jgi:recombination protein RecT
MNAVLPFAGAEPASTNPVATTKKQLPRLRGLLESDDFKSQVARALPRHLTADRFIRIAATAMMRTPKLAECDQASFFNALLSLSQLGLEPDGRNAHLIPFENRKRGVTECQLIIDYKGLVDLAMRSGNVANIHADKVCENDEFEFNLGEIVKHRIDFRRPRGAAYAYYAIVRFKDGTAKCEVLTKEDVDAIRSRSRAGQNGPWVTDYDEMSKKSAFRRLSKWIQLSPEFRDALDADADRIEERARFEAAKPAFVVEQPAPALPEPDSAATPPKRARKPKADAVAEPSAAQVLRDRIEAGCLEAGITVEDLLATLQRINVAKDAWALSDVTEEDATKIVDDWENVVDLVKNGGAA